MKDFLSRRHTCPNPFELGDKIMNKVINIEVQPSGKIDYGGNEKCHVNPGDEIEWECSGAFAFQFLKTTPFAQKRFQSNAVSGGKHGLKLRVPPNAAKKAEHFYAVAVSAGDRVFLDAECPAIIID
jgi:hypothetical protein